MIYIDTSVILAELFAEDRTAPAALWDQRLFSSRLVEIETWVRVNAMGRAASHGDAVTALLARITKVELAGPILARTMAPFPTPVRTLDAIHLATALLLKERRIEAAVATFDVRLETAARALGLDIVPLA